MTAVTISYARQGINRRQRGVSLIEAMVAALLLSVLFLGMAYALSRGLVTQRYMNTQSIALLEMRDGLQQPNKGVTALCGGETPQALTKVGSLAVTKTCTPAGAPITVNLTGFVLTVTPPQGLTLSTPASAASEGLFGGNGVITLSDQ